MSRSVFPATTQDGKFRGRLSDKDIERIEKIRKMQVIDGFSNEIFDFGRSYREEAKAAKLSAYEYAKSRGEIEQHRGELRDYQTVGAAFMYVSRRSILGDGVGLGKTPQVCAVLNRLRSMSEIKSDGHIKKVLVAAEKSAVGQLAAEIERFTGFRVFALQSTGAKMSKEMSNFSITRELDGVEPDGKEVDIDVLVINHSALRSDKFYNWLARVIDFFDTFILDESYVVKNPKAIISNYTKSVCKHMSRVHFLNATVFETKLMDIVNQFNLCYEGLLPVKSYIDKNYCNYRASTFPIRGGGGALGNKWELVGYKNQAELKNALSLVYMTRKRDEVNASKAERYYQVYTIESTRQQRQAISRGYRYFEVLNCPSLCEGLDMPNEPTLVPKLRRLIDLVESDFEGQSIVIYVFHIEMQEAMKRQLEAIGRRVTILNGDTKNRDELREDFNSKKYDVMITNAKRSLNLYTGSVCIFYSMETNPAAVEQIAGRIDRNVNDDAKTFVLLAYEGEEVNFYINTVAQRSKDSEEFTDVASDTVTKFGELLLEMAE